MFDRAGYMFDVEVGVELRQFFVYELSAIVGYDRMWGLVGLDPPYEWRASPIAHLLCFPF